jgi:hypothetical protein
MVTATRPSATGSIVIAERIAGIVRIFDRDVNAVVLRRRMYDALDNDVSTMLPELPQSRKLVVEPGLDAHQRVRRELGSGFALTDDVAFWAGVTADLCDAPLVGARLARAESPMCPRFHVDRVLLRIVISYRGPGTELIADGAVDRSKLAPNHGGHDDHHSGLICEPSAVWRANAGDVVIMKGELWPADVGGVVHRSPHHEGTRVVLTLDPLG